VSFNEKDAALIMHQLLQGISYCHSKNIIHRNIKPENIMFEDKKGGLKSTLKLIHFGSSLQLEPKEDVLRMVGSSYYLAPEVL